MLGCRAGKVEPGRVFIHPFPGYVWEVGSYEGDLLCRQEMGSCAGDLLYIGENGVLYRGLFIQMGTRVLVRELAYAGRN